MSIWTPKPKTRSVWDRRKLPALTGVWKCRIIDGGVYISDNLIDEMVENLINEIDSTAQKELTGRQLMHELRGSWLAGCVEEQYSDFYFRYDTGDSTEKENFDVYLDVQSQLREFGWQLLDPCIEHDCISGIVKPV